jgi:hypothetical protein
MGSNGSLENLWGMVTKDAKSPGFLLKIGGAHFDRILQNVVEGNSPHDPACFFCGQI